MDRERGRSSSGLSTSATLKNDWKSRSRTFRSSIGIEPMRSFCTSRAKRPRRTSVTSCSD